MSMLRAMQYFLFERAWYCRYSQKLSRGLRVGLLIFPYIFIGFVFKSGYDLLVRALALFWCIAMLVFAWYDFDLYLSNIMGVFLLVVIAEYIAIGSDLNKVLAEFYVGDELDAETPLGIALCPILFLPAVLRAKVTIPFKQLSILWSFVFIAVVINYTEQYYWYIIACACISVPYFLFQLFSAGKRFREFVNDPEPSSERGGAVLDKRSNYYGLRFGNEVMTWLQPHEAALQDKFTNFWQVLDVQFTKGEVTHLHYKSVVEELYAVAQSQIKRLFILKYSIAHITDGNTLSTKKMRKNKASRKKSSESNLGNVERKVDRLGNRVASSNGKSANLAPSSVSEVELSCKEGVEKSIDSVLATIEQIKTKLAVLSVSLGSIDTDGSETTVTFNKAIEETQELIDRIGQYDVRNS